MKMFKQQITTTFFSLVLLIIGACPAFAAIPEDSSSLEGVKGTKAIFDINFTEPEKFVLYLSVIEETHNSLRKQGYKPDFIIAFRGGSVRLITKETWSFSEEDQLRLHKGADILKQLSGQGVRLEACSIATKLFKVDNKSLLPAVKPVGNTFVSLIGYQAKGYSLIPIQ